MVGDPASDPVDVTATSPARPSWAAAAACATEALDAVRDFERAAAAGELGRQERARNATANGRRKLRAAIRAALTLAIRYRGALLTADSPAAAARGERRDWPALFAGLADCRFWQLSLWLWHLAAAAARRRDAVRRAALV